MNNSSSNKHLNLLRETPAFGNLNDEALEQLSLLFTPISYKKGEQIPIRRGHNEPYLYLICSGLFSFNLLIPNKPIQTLLFFDKRCLAGGFLAYTSTNNETSIVASENSSALQISSKEIALFFNEHTVGFNLFNDTLRKKYHHVRTSIFLYARFQIHDTEIFNLLGNEICWKELANGDVLFRQDDTSDSIYLVISGRLKAVTKTNDGNSHISNIIKAGETSGEVALLTNSPRHSTVFAIRDSVVASFSRKAFNTIAKKYPQSMLQLSKLLGNRLKRQTNRKRVKTISKVYAIIPTGEEHCLNDFAHELRHSMQEWGSCLCLSSEDIDKALGIKGIANEQKQNTRSTLITQWLEQQEYIYDHILLVADCTWSNWNEKLLRHADQLLLVADTLDSFEPNDNELRLLNTGLITKHLKKSLILIHPDNNQAITGTDRWLKNRKLNEWLHIRDGKLSDMQRLGRVLTGNANALVLGGGGARGYSHIGVIRALEEQGIPIDKVCGTSIGAIISSGVAIGYDSHDISLLCKKHLQKLFDYTLPILSLIRGRYINKEFNLAFGEQRIEDLALPFFCVSTNLTRAEQVIHDRGVLKDALRCSMSLPAMIPPVCSNGDIIVDGGLLNNLPIDQMQKAAGDCNIIAVDISPKLDLTNNESFPSDISGLALFISRINPFQKSIKTPSILGVLERSITLAAVNFSLQIQEKNMAELYLELPVENVSTLDYSKVDQVADLGYTASINKIKKWVSKPN